MQKELNYSTELILQRINFFYIRNHRERFFYACLEIFAFLAYIEEKFENFFKFDLGGGGGQRGQFSYRGSLHGPPADQLHL